MKPQKQSLTEQQLDDVLFDEVSNIDADKEYWFQLRGDNINQLIDAASPLIGMVLRVRKLADLQDVQQLYDNSVDDISAIEAELTESGYDRAIILAYRYVLCCFIDEAVMNTAWGADSVWAQHSLLTRFHNETWGGEKVFSILQRLETEPGTYQELLEFIYLCFSLGFEGRYKVMENGREEFDKIVNRLFETLRNLREEEPQLLTSATEHVVNTRFQIGRQMPIWTVFAGFFAMLTVIFIFYSVSLANKSAGVLDKLYQILN
ncbi:DotU family type IV/VI secretion system protein [Shewanella psychropiezotolerans]|uniref:DotU family type IV/VI secretion system protein n=1 Tax=Shewanella psychropiezotolerans TaxID=2593655 RepID=A0ABX5X0Q2_9GAMM|nr:MULTISPECIES: type IVB secretion system protein IcmH/DotU [Shewanella]MPY24020.1 DotU family type IV/VI secretion system protein [Shewanella sp. YLB-07]QDO84272.1 DotU family type IV/VI secretion system protein [Shewanella psychropiezotolerans]